MILLDHRIIREGLTEPLFLRIMTINLHCVFRSVYLVFWSIYLMLQGHKLFSRYPLNRFLTNVVIEYEVAVVAFQEKTQFSLFNKGFF